MGTFGERRIGATLAKRIGVLALALTAALAACAKPGGQSSAPSAIGSGFEGALAPTREDVAAAFRDIAGVAGSDRNKPVVKWDGELRVAVLGQTDYKPAIVDRLKRALADVAELTPLTVRYTTEEPNFVVIVTDRFANELDEYGALLRPAYAYDSTGRAFDRAIAQMKGRGGPSCHANSVSNRDKRFTFYAIVVAADTYGSPEWCVVENVMAGIGLGGNRTKKDSVHNVTLRRTRLTEIDRQVIATYYRPEIAPGMTHGEAADVFAALLDRR